MRRPDVFTLDYSHPLAQGLVFAKLDHEREASFINRSGQSVSAIHRLDENGTKVTSFNGVSGNGVIFDSPVPTMSTSPITISAWAMATEALVGSESVVFIYGPTSLRYISLEFSRIDLTNSVVLNTRFGTGGIRTAYADVYRQSEWMHLVGEIIPSTSVRVFADGILGEMTGVPQQSALTATKLQIGTMRPMLNGDLTGSVGDVLVHNRALSPAEIAILADRTDPMLGGLVREVNQVAYFDFGGTSSTVDNLTATDLVTGSPALGTPALGQVHALTATGITTSAPALGTPALGQVHGLAATVLTVSAPVLGTPAVGQVHSLVASALVVGSPVLGTPLLSENAPDVDALTAVDLVVGSPVLGTPSLGQIHVLGSDGLTVSSPVFGTPSLEIAKDHLAAQDLATEGPVLGTPALRQIHALVASFSTAAPEIGTPALTQAHALIPANLAAGSPVLGTPMLFDLKYTLQTRAELKSLGTTNFASPLYGATHIELRCYGNYEVNEFGE